MTVFGAYAAYYDLLYRDKDYTEEAVYVKSLLERHGKQKVRKILDLGCGTARHDIVLAALGYEVVGVDRSPEMLAMAKKRFTGRLVEGDVRNLDLGEQFAAVLSLFHVMSYQTTDEDVLATMRTAKRHLREGGVFLFDFWYGPAVLAQRPERRVKEMGDEKIKVVRYCDPFFYEDRHVIDVRYDIHITSHDLQRMTYESCIQETHSMRYFFREEMERFLSQSSFRPTCFLAWMGDAEPTDKDWSAIFVTIRL